MRSAECGVRNNNQDRMQKMDCEISPPHFALRIPNSNGFTLIEIVITIVIVSILSGLAAMIILQGVRAYSDERSRSDVHYQSRAAMERMAREIRMIRWDDTAGQADVTTMTATMLRYTDIQGIRMGFRLSGTEIQRTEDNAATWQTLASGVQSLNFAYFQQDGIATAADATTLWFVAITMTDKQGAETLPMRTRVHPRNF
jgi:MSHA biogenesis protein MshO